MNTNTMDSPPIWFFLEDFFSFIHGYCSCIPIIANGETPIPSRECDPYPANEYYSFILELLSLLY